MTPKEKSEYLVDKYQLLLNQHIFNGNYDISKQFALETINEILNIKDLEYEDYIYYQEVRIEIEKL